eukprot:352737-Chlamydomonas_euryale.AAC.2
MALISRRRARAAAQRPSGDFSEKTPFPGHGCCARQLAAAALVPSAPLCQSQRHALATKRLCTPPLFTAAAQTVFNLTYRYSPPSSLACGNTNHAASPLKGHGSGHGSAPRPRSGARNSLPRDMDMRLRAKARASAFPITFSTSP